MFDNYVELSGSHKNPHPTATVVPHAWSNETCSVVVVPRLSEFTDKDLASFMNFARQNNFMVEAIPGGLKCSGIVADLAAAFRVTLDMASDGYGHTFRHRTGTISIPVECEPWILAVLGLDDRPFLHPHFHYFYSSQITALTPEQLAQLYSFIGDGNGIKSAILSLGGGHSATNLQAVGVNPSRCTDTNLAGGSNGYTGNPQSADVEGELDVQTLLRAAPKSTCEFVNAPNTDAGFYAGIAYITAGSNGILSGSASWGAPESEVGQQAVMAMNQLLANAKVPMFFSSGDSGLDDGTKSATVDWPACCARAIAVGGTLVSTNPFSESLWNDLKVGGGAAGYGISQSIPKPTYQNNVPGNFRVVPDIVADASPSSGVLVALGAQRLQIGGTSLSAPLMNAAYTCFLSHVEASQRPSDIQGYLYSHPECFNRVTVTVDPSYAVGLGSVNWAKLAQSIVVPAPVNPPPNPPAPSPPPITPCEDECLGVAVGTMNAFIADFNALNPTQQALAYQHYLDLYNGALAVYNDIEHDVSN